MPKVWGVFADIKPALSFASYLTRKHGHSFEIRKPHSHDSTFVVVDAVEEECEVRQGMNNKGSLTSRPPLLRDEELQRDPSYRESLERVRQSLQRDSDYFKRRIHGARGKDFLLEQRNEADEIDELNDDCEEIDAA